MRLRPVHVTEGGVEDVVGVLPTEACGGVAGLRGESLAVHEDVLVVELPLVVLGVVAEDVTDVVAVGSPVGRVLAPPGLDDGRTS